MKNTTFQRYVFIRTALFWRVAARAGTEPDAVLFARVFLIGLNQVKCMPVVTNVIDIGTVVFNVQRQRLHNRCKVNDAKSGLRKVKVKVPLHDVYY